MSNPENLTRQARFVKAMFGRVSTHYDKINNAMCLGLDKSWRRKISTILAKKKLNSPVIDIACGSGDVAIEILKNTKANVICVDFCPEMLTIAKEKIEKLGFGKRVEFFCADCESLPFADASFSSATIAFGLRNFQNREKCLREIYRILEKNSMLVVLEVARAHTIFQPIQNFFMGKFVPNIANILGGNKKDYKYLADTTKEFPSKIELEKFFKNAKFKDIKTISLAFGFVAITIAEK